MKIGKTYIEFISEKKSKKKSPAAQIKKLTKKQKTLIDKSKDIKDEVSKLAADKDKNPEDKLTSLLLKNKINQTEIDGQKIAIQKQQIALNSKIKGVKKKKKSMPKNEQLSAYADEISLEEGLFGWLSGVFKNPGLKRKVRKLKDELVRTRIELGNLKLEGDPIEEFEAELKAKNDKYTTSRNNNRSTNNQNGANAHELRIKTLENSEETIISGMDALSQENEILQKYVDKIKLEARMESNNAIIRAADTHIARVIKKIQIKDKKAIKQMDGEIENLMKQDESYMSYLNESILNEEDSYSDYPETAKKNAQKAIDWKEKYGRDEVDAGTAVGWARAHQLAKGENISGETVKRMSSFNRHRKNSTIATEYKDTPWKDKGHVSWLIWGGTEGVDWAMKKSKEIDTMKESKQMKHIEPLDIKPLNEAVKYETKGYKVGDKIKTNIAEWEIVETDYKPKETFASPFVFKGKEMEQLPLNAKRTTKGAVGYKVTDGAKYPIFGFLYQYKGNLGSKSLITKLAIMDVDESVVAEGNYNMEDIYDLIAHHRFDKDFEKLSSKDKEWVKNDAKERGFNESLLESDMADMYYSLIDELYEAKPGPKPYHRGLDDDEIEDKKAQIKKQSDMDDDDSSAYKEMPGDKEARKKGEVKTSKHVKKYHELYGDKKDESVVTENKELMKIDSYLNTKDESVLVDFLDDAYGNSDDRRTRREWEAARNYLSYGELVDYAVTHAENFGMDLQDIEDAVEVYEHKINERKTISSSKISMMGAKILRKISIGTIFDTEDGEYEITDYGRQANAFKEFEAEHNGKQVKVKLTAMYGVTLEVTDDIRSARFNKEVRLNSIILESAVNEAESIKVGKYIKTQYGYFYKRVDGKVGGQEAFVEIKKGKEGKRKTSIHDTVDFEIVDKDVAFESVVNEEKIKYAKGKTYQSSGHWTVMVDSNSSMCDIRVNSSAGWRLDPHDDREETWELLDGGRQRATIYFRRGSIDKFAQQMFDLNDRTTWGNKTKLTAKDYADIIRVWIDMKKANESVITEKRYPSFNFGMKKQYNADDINQMYGFWGTLDVHMETEEIEEIWNDVWGILTKGWKFSDAGALYYLNAKAGRWLADKVWNDINSQISQPDAIDMILSDYARPSKWKAWSKEYNEFAQEELAEHVILEKAEGDRGPISDPKIEKALKTKSEETGVPIGIIRIIMRRGMAAWKTGHRPGATEQQWGYARVNAFLTKGAGTWGDADKDVAKEVRDGGYDKGLKS